MGFRSTKPSVNSSLRLAFVAVCAAWLCTGACTTERMTNSYYRPMPPKPRPLPPTPPDARANALVLSVSAAPLDTNGNGYPDLIHASAHLFDTRYAPAIPEEGAFVFQMFASGDAGRPGGEPIRQWRIAGEEAQQALARSAFGACYRFRLSMLDDGTDMIGIPVADVVARFEPADGRKPTYAAAVSTIQIGERVVVPRLIWREDGKSLR